MLPFPSMLVGGSIARRVSLNGGTCLKNGAGVVVSTYTVAADGNAYKNGVLMETWLLTGAAADYEVRADVTSGTLSSGTTGTWLGCATNRSWTVTALAGNSESATIHVQIRDAVSHSVLAEADVDIMAHSSG